MAHTSTDGLCVAAQAAPPPPPRARVIPLAQLSCSINAVARRSGSGGIDCLSCGGAAGVRRHGGGHIIPPT